MDDTERAPLIGDWAKPKALYYVTGAALILVIILAASTVTLAVLYGNSNSEQVKKSLPKWPGPSLSPLGKYTDAAVAADNGYCSEIGRDVLLRGGNAVDSAIATLFCIGVMDSHSAGLGGGHFLTLYNIKTKRCHVIDAREPAPERANETMYVNTTSASKIGWKAIAVPGELHGLRTAYDNWGSGMPWADLLQPTIDFLDYGFPTSNALASALKAKSQSIKKEPTMQVFINPDTKDVYKAGELIKTRKTFLKTLRILANSSNPIKEFYNGSLTAGILEEFDKNGGLITASDLANYKSLVRPDSQVIYTKLPSGRVICGPPPPSGSAVAQAILNVINGYKMDQTTFDGNVNIYHRYIEASKFAYAAHSELGDMAFVDHAFPLARNMTSQLYAKAVRQKITDHTHPDDYYGGDFAPVDDHGTTHITVMDKFGNAVSVTSTINLYFGAGVRSESTGVIWNDEMDDFSTPGQPNAFGYPPSKANFIKPGKKPQSSMSPIVIFDSHTGRPELAVGGAGGSTIISGVATVAMHALWLNKNVKEAVDAPRLHNQLMPNVTRCESTFPKEYVDSLTVRGHNIKLVGNLTVITAIEHEVDGNTYANSDFRKGTESYTAGY